MQLFSLEPDMRFEIYLSVSRLKKIYSYKYAIHNTLSSFIIYCFQFAHMSKSVLLTSVWLEYNYILQKFEIIIQYNEIK